MVVFEEVDSLADQDRGFLSAITNLVSDTKACAVICSPQRQHLGNILVIG